MEKSERVPESLRGKFDGITTRTDAFCKRYLNDEYRRLIRRVVAALCRKRPSPLLQGGEDTWAAGAVHAIGMANFTFDKARTPHCTAPDIYTFFGIAASTGQGKSKLIRDLLKIRPFVLEWTLPSQADSSPIMWIVQVDGFFVDARDLPLALQEAAYRKGLIPYVPGTQQE